MTGALNRERFSSLVEAGVLAPSADNSHALLFDQSGDVMRIWGNTEFHSAPFHRRILSLISLGAVAENIALRAVSLGLTPAVSWNLPPEPGQPLASVSFSASYGPVAEGLAQAIAQRHTNRAFFHGPGVSATERVQLDDDASSIPGAKLIWLDAPSQRRRVLTLIRLAESERFRSRLLHEELFRSIRFDAGWTRSTEEGLAPGSLGVEKPLRAVFAALRHWSLMHGLSYFGMHWFLGLRAGDAPCRFAPNLGVLASTLPLESGALAVGRSLERVWLRATSFGMAFQALAASTLFALEGYEAIELKLRERLRRGWAELAPGTRPLIVFRLGRSASQSVRSGRKPISSYVRG